MQGLDKDLFPRWVGADTLDAIIRKTPASGPPPGSIGPTGIGTYHSFITPNVLREARAHFGCPQMDGVLMEEAGNRVTDHFSVRHYNVRAPPLLRAQAGFKLPHDGGIHTPAQSA